jgi:hypothetical protein
MLSGAFQICQDALQMGSRVEVFFGVVGNDSMKISANVRVSDGSENVIDDIVGAKIEFRFFEKLNRVRNQTTFRHTKEVIQRF